jgi:hypothetical protein
MKRLVLFASLLSIITASCTKDDSNEVTCGATTPSFSTEVYPVLQQKCISCHGDVMPRGNVSLNNYTKVSANKSAVRNIFVSTTSHEGVSVTTAQRNTVCCWIDSDAPNN